MSLIDERVKTLTRKIINAFEMGRTTVDYGVLYIMNDGPGGIKMLTVSWGLTEFGNLKTFISRYISANAKFSVQFLKYLPLIGKSTLSGNTAFKDLLKKAAKEDQKYRDIMDQMYEELYVKPAMKFFNDEGLTLPLTYGLIFDSFLHSGQVLASIRNTFKETTPKRGGNEQIWAEQYALARRKWLANHSKAILHNTVYRMDFFISEIRRNNWMMDKFPIFPHDVKITA